MSLKDKLGEKIDAWRPRTTKLLKEHGAVKISDVTIAQAIGGARGVRCLVTDISYTRSRRRWRRCPRSPAPRCRTSRATSGCS
jgi:hypothetical protein